MLKQAFKALFGNTIKNRMRQERGQIMINSRSGLGAMTALILGLATIFSAGAMAGEQDERDESRWPAIRDFIFYENQNIQDGSEVIDLGVPYRALDAAVVPVTMKALFPQTKERFIKTLYLIIDNNPSPLGGMYKFNGKNGDASITTRVRVNDYTYVRAIAETNDGKVYMVKRYVKASGGCAAPVAKDQEAAKANIGRMKLKLPERIVAGQTTVAQILVSHPNNSGFQADPITLLSIPSYYMKRMEVTYNGDTVFTLDTDISMSTDPSVHFSFVPKDKGEIKVRVIDSKEKVFVKKWKINPVPDNQCSTPRTAEKKTQCVEG